MPINRLRHAIEPLLRRVLHAYWRFSRGMTLGVRAVVLDADGRVFLIKHSYVAGWHLPGGGVEPGETLLTALAREVFEEGNVVAVSEPALHGVYFNDSASRRDHVALYVIRDFRQDGAPKPNAEIIDHGFFAMPELPADTTGATRRRLAEVLEGAAIAQHW